MTIKYYLVHNGTEERRNVMTEQFIKWGFDTDNIKWVIHPNKHELDEDLINKVLLQVPCQSNDRFVMPSRMLLRRGLISCTYKHYLCLKDIVENGYDYAVIMEDNVVFSAPIPHMIDIYIQQLRDHYNGEWDILFNYDWVKYSESPVHPDLFVYPKTNEITNQCHGGTKSAGFYLLTNACAKLLYDNYLPFYDSPDWYMNDLFRKLNIRSFWVEPAVVHTPDYHKSGTANVDRIEGCTF
jgi:GR25 family glycosyltransferase involved in LPS biosynthesis